ncbi:PQQ-dependent sugar dehydrogenase [Solimonas marina]|uniref:C-type cytochrome n=1 Tax=Solimonas marina TaxID=2714601 RepID=A0A969W9V4_9GAMM|nr:PQQ-dependent sugar dehydrogenase [Solimonas marina]NKF21000.1 c-type cytochrome [Solimonas marina]
MPVTRLPALAVLALCALGNTATAQADAQAGRQRFEQNCAICHSAGRVAGGAVGPDLGGVVGRAAAVVDGYGYTRALRDAGLTWDAATLDRFLAAPSKLVPGTAMPVATPDAAQRADLIAFLATTHAATSAATPAAGAAARSTAGDWRRDAPGQHHQLDLASLPAPYATPSSRNRAQTLAQPRGAWPKVPPGFVVSLWADDLSDPRRLRVAPNGDVFVAETTAGRVRVLRGADGTDHAERREVFVDGLDRPFGIAFYPAGNDPHWIYIAENNRVLRYPYRNGDLEVRGKAQTIVAKIVETTGGHTTRDLQFSADGRQLFISVGSGSNVAEGMPGTPRGGLLEWQHQHGLGASWGGETGRADVLVTDPLGTSAPRAYATGIRNCVGMTVQPANGALWCATNERDGLGDDLVPDYVTRVDEGAFYGWPWYYFGDHEDPRHAGARPDLKGKVRVPDVPLQAHSAALGIVFYDADRGVAQFPATYRGDAFVALHGSWNRSLRTGYKLVRVPMQDGQPRGGYEDFMTGFVLDDDRVWGRPVGVDIAHDGALLVSDDVGERIWRIAPVTP